MGDMKRLICILALILLFSTPALADTADIYEEQLRASGADELIRQCPSDTAETLEEWGVTPGSSSLRVESIFHNLWTLIGKEAASPLRHIVILCAAILLTAGMGGVGRIGASLTVRAVGITATTATAAIPLAACIGRMSTAVTTSLGVMTAFAPVYAGILVSAGQAASALTFETVMLAVCEVAGWLVSKLILPLTVCAFAIGTAGGMSEEGLLRNVSTFLQKNATWLLTGIMTLFLGILSIQNLTDYSADVVSARVVKFSAANLVPVVGGAMAESVNAVRGCLEALKGSVGTFGVAAGALILLPPVLECAAWNLAFSFCAMVADALGCDGIGRVLKTGQSTVKLLIAVAASLAVFFVICVTVTAKGGAQ